MQRRSLFKTEFLEFLDLKGNPHDVTRNIIIEWNGKFSIDYLASIMAANLAKTRSNWYTSNAHVTQSAFLPSMVCVWKSRNPAAAEFDRKLICYCIELLKKEETIRRAGKRSRCNQKSYNWLKREEKVSNKRRIKRFFVRDRHFFLKRCIHCVRRRSYW